MALFQSPIGLVEVLSVNLSATANNVTGDSTFYTVAFDNIVKDTANGWNNTTHQYTVKRTGLYAVSVNIGLSSINNPAYSDYLLDITGGTNQGETYGNPYVMVNSSSRLGLNANNLFYLSAGDLVYCIIQISGGAKTVNVVGGSSLSLGLIRETT